MEQLLIYLIYSILLLIIINSFQLYLLSFLSNHPNKYYNKIAFFINCIIILVGIIFSIYILSNVMPLQIEKTSY